MSIQRLVLWAVTTLLLGHSEAKGKNIAFHAGRAGLNVAGLHDRVGVLQHDPFMLEHALAMAFGDVFVLEDAGPLALANFGGRCGIQRSFLARELETPCDLAREEATQQLQDPVYRGSEIGFVQQIAALVERRALALKSMAW